MIRFIDIGNQIYIDIEHEDMFSFYCTVWDKYEQFAGNSAWQSKSEFIEDYNFEADNRVVDDLDRYINLIPEKFQH